MKTLKLENDDLVFENGDFVLDENDVEQGVEVILKSGKEEWFYNSDLGLNRSNILGKVSNEKMRSEIISGIAQEPRVTLIEEINIEKINRTSTITFKGVKDGTGSIEGKVEMNAR